METTKHTPGPWKPENGYSVWATDKDGMEKRVAYMDRNHMDLKGGEPEANAHLIAAAPDMLEALEVMTSLCRIKYGNLDKDVYNEILKAESALNKAKGL